MSNVLQLLYQQAFQHLVFREEIDHAMSMYGCKVTPSATICGIIRDFFNTYQSWPGLEELVMYQYEPCVSDCDNAVPLDDALPILMYGIQEYGQLFSCRVTHFFHVFQFTEGRYPRYDEISIALSEHRDAFMNDIMQQNVDEFWAHAKSGVDITQLEVRILEEKHPESCAICQEDMNSSQKVVTLPCHHTFHSSSDECSGIQSWLEKVNACPLCKHAL
jgi:hypothetical protein